MFDYCAFCDYLRLGYQKNPIVKIIDGNNSFYLKIFRRVILPFAYILKASLLEFF